MPLTPKVNEDTDPKRTYRNDGVGDEESLIVPKTDVENDKIEDYARRLAFMNEEVEVMVLPSADPNDQTKLVEISVNGRTEYFLRGQWKKVKRYYLEVLATAKHQSWDFAYRQALNGATVQTQESSHILRYPHQFRDTNPNGYKWYDSIKNRAF